MRNRAMLIHNVIENNVTNNGSACSVLFLARQGCCQHAEKILKDKKQSKLKNDVIITVKLLYRAAGKYFCEV